MKSNYGLLPLLNSLAITQIEVMFTPSAPLEQKAWLGAAVRNRFLTACESVTLADGKTLREKFDVCTLPADHFLYKQYCNGFPKCFVWDVSPARPHLNGFCMEPDREYRMRLYLFGIARLWIEEIKTAIRQMMSLGLGAPAVSLRLSDMMVHEPVRLESLAGSFFANQFADGKFYFTLKTLTPLSLLKNHQGSSDGFQRTLNGFPSLYQITRTCASRFATLNILYAEDKTAWQHISTNDEWDSLIDGLAEAATDAWLCSANIKQVSLYSTPKQGVSVVYSFAGYIGELTFSRVDPLLVPVIKLMGQAAIGNDVSFGLGFFEADVHKLINGSKHNNSKDNVKLKNNGKE